MKKLLNLFIFLIISGCVQNNVVYWCGDHKCINKKEKEAYFKKTMIVETRILSKNKDRKKSKLEDVIQQAGDAFEKKSNSEINEIEDDGELNELEKQKITKKLELEERMQKEEEETLAKKIKDDKKKELIEKKELAKKIKEDEQKRLIEEKELAKKIKEDEKKRNTKKNEIAKKVIKNEEEKKVVQIIADTDTSINSLNEFDNVVERIMNKNSTKPYPNINNVPE